MPFATFDLGTQTASIDMLGRQLIPGIEPGGALAGRTMKPALIFTGASWKVENVTDADAAGDFQHLEIYVKLSQEEDLTPGFLLHVADLHLQKTGTANIWNNVVIKDHFQRHVGSIWVPKFVGVRLENVSGVDAIESQLYLEYEPVLIPWMEYMIRWDFLDNIPDNSVEY